MKRKRKNMGLLLVAFFVILAIIFLTKIIGDSSMADKEKVQASISSEQADLNSEQADLDSEQDSKQPAQSGEETPEKSGEETPEKSGEFLILVNKQHSLEASYKPEDLTDIKYFASDRTPASRFMRKEASEQFHKLVEGAKVSGYELVMTTAYRSYGFQNILFTNYVKKHGEAEANKFSAKPGESEHQTGLAVDVSSPTVQYQLTSEFGETAEGQWMAEHAHEYGFIVRFLKGKEDITGYQYEPWHLRYVGQPAADEIYEQGITLEEYLEE